jgi:arabinogalactan oligomer/maltooligosaccharide transport system substrate-binding protein
MQDMLALAQADPSLGSGLYMNLYHLYWGITGYGGTLFDGEGRVILDQTPGPAEFLAWLRQMSETPGVFVSQDYGMLIDRFKKGEFAFFVDGPWSQIELTQALGDALAIAPLPEGAAGPARPWLSADGLFFNPTSSPHQRSLALTLADHMTSPASGTLLAEIARRVPAQADAVIDDALLLGFAQQAQVALSEPHRPEMLQVWGYAGDMLIKVVEGDMDPAEAVRETTLLINEANGK